MEPFARLVTRQARFVLLLVAALSIALTIKLPLGYDDDVVRFLPADDPEVAAFEKISDRFGSLDVALVAVEAPDVFTHARLTYVRTLTERLRALPEVEHVTSVTELAIIKGGAEGSHVALVPATIPTDPAALKALRDNILGLDYIAGMLASEDGEALLLVTQLRKELPDHTVISSKRAAEAAKAAALALPAPDDTRLHFGGAPFIAEAAANGSQSDLARLAPYVVGITLLLVILSLGSFWAALYTVLTVGLSILWTLGVMGWLGRPLTLVSTSLPVILVALGSAYAVHILVWYREHDGDPVGAVRAMGWPIVVTAATTAAGFVSFLIMDLAPMREFGWQMALGTVVSAFLALTLIPALLEIKPIPVRPSHVAGVDRWLVKVALACRRRRWPLLIGASAVAVLLATRVGDVDTRMDTSAFFAEDSAPARADRLMTEEFGGSVFLQVLVDGDIRDPAVLHRIAAFGDRVSAVPGVTRIQSIDRVLAVVYEGLKEVRRTSRDRDEITLLGSLARMTDPAVDLLVGKEWDGALMQISIGGFDTGVVGDITAQVRALADAHLVGAVATVPRAEADADAVYRDAAERVAALARKPATEVPAIEAILREGLDDEARHALSDAVRDTLKREVVEEEMVELADPERWKTLADVVTAELAAGRLDKARFVALLRPVVTDEEREDAESFARGAEYVFTKVSIATAKLLEEASGKQLGVLVAGLGPAARMRVEDIVDELRQPTWYTPVSGARAAADDARPISVTVSGQPIIQEAMTHSVQRNQVLSLLVSLPLVLLIMIIVFRSVIAGVIGILPAGLTLLVTFGLMGLFPDELPMDIAASMLASIALGVGIDYAIHFMWRYRQGGIEAAMRTTGRAIVINAGEITGGFIVLAWASIAPMSRFGILTAETLLVAALATLVLLPALLTWWNPPRPAPDERSDETMVPTSRPSLNQLAPLLFALALGGAALAPSPARADAFSDAKGKGAQAMLAESDRLTNHYDSQQWKMRMTITPRGSESRVLEFRIWQREQKDRLVRFDAPGEVKGLSMLSNGADVMYVYSPQTDNVRRVASHAKRQTLLGSNLSYDDMGSIDLSDAYTATFGDETATHQWLVLEKKPDVDVGWQTLKVRIDKANLMADQIEYVEGGKTARVQTRTRFEVLDGVPTYRTIEMKTLDDGLVTKLEVLEQKIGEDLPKSMFKKKNLVRGG
ncbi:MAG: outer membrane lipoprotein-sorting protein [Deltaproteobacteria bacterium]|nr:MAG: outer membrane lipoprotein-sorting protein [Deltaproteobacteria bacterium]